jgi:hypothetical protein
VLTPRTTHNSQDDHTGAGRYAKVPMGLSVNGRRRGMLPRPETFLRGTGQGLSEGRRMKSLTLGNEAVAAQTHAELLRHLALVWKPRAVILSGSTSLHLRFRADLQGSLLSNTYPGSCHWATLDC